MSAQTQIAIAVYSPHAGKSEELLDVIKNHLPTLRQEGLITDRPALLMQAADGAYVEIFEWAAPDAAEKAHQLPSVQAVWGKIAELAEMPPLSTLQEAKHPFSHFTPVNL